MNVFLVNHYVIPDFEKSLLTGQEFSFSVAVDMTSRSSLFVGFLSDLTKKFGNGPSTIDVTMKFEEPMAEDKEHMDYIIEMGKQFDGVGAWNVKSLKSSILKNIHEVLFYGCESDSLKITVDLKCISRRSTPNRRVIELSTSAEDFFPDSSHDVYVQRERRYVDHKTIYPAISGNYVHSWYLSIAVELYDGFMPLGSIIPIISDAKRQIFLERNACDFAILTEDGSSQIPCHKVHLSEKSQVLSRICYGEFKEARDGKMSMEDMSTDGVVAFLQYIYYDGLHEAVKSCDISRQLLIASDKYELVNLFNALEAIILAKDPSWFDSENALAMFSFVEQLERANLKKKLFRVLAEKKGEIAELDMFTELFPNPESRRMFFVQLDMADIAI